MTKLKIEEWPVTRPKPYLNNARVHPKTQIDALVKAMKEFGTCAPIGVDKKGVIVYGHGRLQAAIKAKFKTIPVIILSHLTTDQCDRLRIADNQIGLLSEWDIDKLSGELARFVTQGSAFDPQSIGFNQNDVNVLLASMGATPQGVPDMATRLRDFTHFGLTVTVPDAKTQKELYDELAKRGYEIRLLTF